VFRRIASYAIQSSERLPVEATALLIANAVDLVVFIDQRYERHGGVRWRRRFVSSVLEVVGADDRLVVSNDVFRPGPDGRAVPGVPFRGLDDLVAEGFDPTLGYTFASYAAPTILGEIKRHFRDRGRQVHLPRGLQERIALIERAVDDLPTKLARAPSAADVAAHTGLDIEEVLEAMEAASARRPYSLDATVGPDEDAAFLVDTLGDVDLSYETVEYGEAIASTLALLPERERVILNLRFVEDLTQSEIAKRVGISQMHVSRLLRRALDAVRAQVPQEGG